MGNFFLINAPFSHFITFRRVYDAFYGKNSKQFKTIQWGGGGTISGAKKYILGAILPAPPPHYQEKSPCQTFYPPPLPKSPPLARVDLPPTMSRSRTVKLSKSQRWDQKFCRKCMEKNS